MGVELMVNRTPEEWAAYQKAVVDIGRANRTKRPMVVINHTETDDEDPYGLRFIFGDFAK